MKYYSFVALFALLILAAGACSADSMPAPDLEATVEMAVKATLAARPTDTPAPDIETTVAAAVRATLVAQPTGTPSIGVQPVSNPERLYRSYPAPTGFPGFRKYYQKRCYPGCHYDASASEAPAGTPTPQVAHP